MLAMNKVQPPAKTPKDFYIKFLRVGAENRTVWHYANDLGFFKPSNHGSSSNQNNDYSDSASKQKRQKRGDDFRERSNSSKPFNTEICWTCGTVELNVTRVYILTEIRRMCPSCRALWVRDGLLSS
jgi:Zn-finger nucleic acid-binding protein